MANQELRVKTRASLGEIVTHLESLVACLKQGQICIHKKEKHIILKPQAPVSIEIEAEAKLERAGLHEKLVVDLRWHKTERIPSEGDRFTITPQEPAEEA